jgi:hypothetical protein
MQKNIPSLEELSSAMPPPQWLIGMHEHYAKHRYYRPEDLARVLGDQVNGISMNADEAIRKLLDGLEESDG